MRIYLVVMDETAEAKKALRFATARAGRTGGNVHILALVPRQNFNAFGGVQATIEQEARERAEVLANDVASGVYAESGKMPVIAVRNGEPKDVIRTYLEEHGSVAALVLGASTEGGPGPLVAHFASAAGSLACPLYIIPGSLEAEQINALAGVEAKENPQADS
jgi:nucleotide-binding universal stress UspA family protein